MTEPSIDTTVETVQGIVNNARELGLTWDVRYAQVVDGDNPAAVVVKFDGDTVQAAQAAVISLVGVVKKDERVAVMSVPPAAQYIIGTVANERRGRGVVSSAYWVGGGTAGSTGTEVALTTWNFVIDTVFEVDRMYRVNVIGGVTNNNAAVSAAQMRIRTAMNSTSAQQLVFIQFLIAAGSSAFALTWSAYAYAMNVSTANLTKTLGVTVQRSLGLGTTSLFGDANIPLMCDVTDIGHVDDPKLAAYKLIAISVT